MEGFMALLRHFNFSVVERIDKLKGRFASLSAPSR